MFGANILDQPKQFTPVFKQIQTIVKFFLQDSRLFSRYVMVGGASAVLEFSLFTFLYGEFAVPLIVANSCAIAITLLFHFNMQKHWTFRDRQAIGGQVWRYVMMIVIATIMNNVLMFIFVAIMQMPAPLAKLLQIGLVFGFSFSVTRLFVFSNQK